MKALFEFNKIILIILFTAMTVFAGEEGGSGGGGANQIEEQFEMARSYIKNSLIRYKNKKEIGSKMDEKERKAIDENLDSLISDVSDVPLEFDHQIETPFANGRGSDSGIRTGGNPLSPIKIRSKVLVPNMKISISRVISEFGHELGHHVPPIKGYDEEQKAWLVSRALNSLLWAQIVAPNLLGIDGDYVAVGGKVCRNLIHVEGDPLTGMLSIASFTSEGNGAYFPQCTRERNDYDSVGTFLFQLWQNDIKLVSHSTTEQAYPHLLPSGIQIHYSLPSHGKINDKPLLQWDFDLKYIRIKSP
ncbi:MAG: hypothetical protein A4S09_09740 [Proteobacteria bacterium SG_bin7]|nr:MAG: hypothetical protein A4S09_09740 [Proteobacteria bacterium SG_bin7]